MIEEQYLNSEKVNEVRKEKLEKDKQEKERQEKKRIENEKQLKEKQEKNEKSNAHPHIFIKKPNKKDYSLEIINKHNLNPSIPEGEDKLDIELIIKNNGAKQWPENGAKLVFNENKNLIARPIFLRPQKPEEQQKYEINMEDLHVYQAGKYEAEMNFEVDGKQYGDEIDLIITIEEKKKIIADNNDNYNDKIQAFRDAFGLDPKEFPDEKILALLKKHNFDFSKAFSALFDD